MSYFDDMEDAWFANNCQGNIEDYGCDNDPGVDQPSRKQRSLNAGTSRNILSVTQLEEFAAWAVKDGFKREDTKGSYEVLRLRWPGYPPYLFFRRSSTVAGNPPVHVTAQGEASTLAKRWLRERKNKSSSTSK